MEERSRIHITCNCVVCIIYCFTQVKVGLGYLNDFCKF